jgi:WS/DGAT/MGAT family acyltransferase
VTGQLDQVVVTMARRRRIPAQDAMFLWGESPETMMHVAALMPFTPPDDAGPSYLRDLMDEVHRAPVESPWNLKLSHPWLLRHPLQSWVADESFDIDYHVRRSALPSPGDERELGILVSRLHSNQIDFRRPPWEMHVIEGLEGDRFAIYVKVHHALVDGFSAVKLLARSLSVDPDDDSNPFFFSVRPTPRDPVPPEARPLVEQVVSRVTSPVTGAAKVASGVLGAGATAARAVARLELARGEDLADLRGPRSAPHTILNAPTGRSRRFATQQYETERLTGIAKAAGGTLNDVVMAICGGGLRAFLLEQGALPEKSLVAFMPVNIRAPGDEGGGNKVGALLATLGTDVEDPVERLQAVIRSTSQAKGQMKGMDQLAALAYSGYLLAPVANQAISAVLGLASNPLPTAFNVCLSNVPGPREALHMRGARLEAVFPMSIPLHGMALNITMESYAGKLCFGFIGCRDAVPHLQHLAVHTGEALEALEEAYGEG